MKALLMLSERPVIELHPRARGYSYKEKRC